MNNHNELVERLEGNCPYKDRPALRCNSRRKCERCKAAQAITTLKAQVAELEVRAKHWQKCQEMAVGWAKEWRGRAEAAEAENVKLREVGRELLQVQDGLPMTGIEATRRAEAMRAALNTPQQPSDAPSGGVDAE